MEPIRWQQNGLKDCKATKHLGQFDVTVANRALQYHQSWPQYQATPRISLPNLAAYLGVQEIWLKDESRRWGLGAFKGLGGTYGVGRYLANYYGIGPSADFFTLKGHLHTRPPVVFATATDGNHGVGIAWAAGRLGHSAKIFMPQGTSNARVRAIEKVGGSVEVTDLDYDATVNWVARQAHDKGWVLVQDTSWPGYQEIPLWIMQGYLTMVAEEFLGKHDRALDKPTHVFLQAGVGSFAAAVVAFLANLYGRDIPNIIVIEPSRAACFYRSAIISDGCLYSSDGALSTIMAGLACGVGNPVAWEILKHWVAAFVACDDVVTARGMRILGNPLPGDPPLEAGESGAVGLGLLSLVATDAKFSHFREDISLGPDSRVLLVNTEGAMDPGMYRRIVWDGHLAGV